MANNIDVKCADSFPPPSELSGNELAEATQFMLGKSLYDTREYRRAAHSLEKCSSPKAVFLRLYSLYLVSVVQPTLVTIYVYVYVYAILHFRLLVVE